MSGDPAKDLEQWIPRLLAVWRQARRGGQGHSPPAQLSPPELREVAAGVRQLSLGLTRERSLAGARYMDDAKLLGAYLLFYWPVSYAQARSVLSELPNRPRATLDLGSGPGPLAFAALDAGAAEVTAADRSESALKLARALAAEAEEALATRAWDPLKPGGLPAGQYDLISMGHVLNELHRKDGRAAEKRAEVVEAALRQLKRGGSVLVLEPALRETSRDLLQVRDLLVAKGYAVRAPCMWRGACPALLKDSDWCHADRTWRMPKLVEAIARQAGLHKESLKMSYLVLAPPGEAWCEPPPGQLYRIVSEPLAGKGRQRYIGCGPAGRVGLALQEKHRSPVTEAFFSLTRGDVVAVTETEERGDGLTLTERSTARRVAWAGQPFPTPPRE